MQLTTGAIAPIFETEDVFGMRWNLTDLRGKKVLLSFFRNGACALCNLQVHRLIEKADAWRKHGLTIIGIFESSTDSVRQNVTRQKVPFTLIADPTGRIYDLYGVENSPEVAAAAVRSVQTPFYRDLIQSAHKIGYELIHEEGANFFRVPADFLIDAEGHIATAFYPPVIGLHLGFDVIEDFLARPA